MLYSKQTFNGGIKKLIFFLCPYGTLIRQFKLPISSLLKAGYSVKAYDFTEQIWSNGDPQGLINAIDQVTADIKETISGNKTYTSIGIFGSSLGSFIGFNAAANIPEIDWFILNTGGDVAQAVWCMPNIRKYFQHQGYSESTLKNVWEVVQYPDLRNLKNKQAILITSEKDEIVPFDGAMKTFNAIIEAGPKYHLIIHKRLNHKRTVIRNLARIRKLVKLVESL
jgi:hypothetical protein